MKEELQQPDIVYRVTYFLEHTAHALLPETSEYIHCREYDYAQPHHCSGVVRPAASMAPTIIMPLIALVKP